MRWQRARKVIPSDRLLYLERLLDQPPHTRNCGIWTEAPARPDDPGLAHAGPAIYAQQERRDTVLWPALFSTWPDWHWGVQPTGDCTRWMQQHLLDVLLSVHAIAGKVRRPDGLVAGESIYGFAKCELVNSYRYHGAGATGWAVAEASVKYGSLYRQRYTEGDRVCDLSGETTLSIDWGDRGRGVPDWLEDEAAEHKAADRLAVRSASEAGLLIQAGYPVQYCGYAYWGTQRDSDGIARRHDSGWHAMTLTGVRWNRDGTPLALWCANTGHGDHCDGPIGPFPMPDVYADCGSWIEAGLVDRVCRAGDCYATTAVAGWPVLKLPDWGWREVL